MTSKPAQSNAPPEDPWRIGAAYDPYVGRWSRLVALKFLDRLAVPSGSRWLDVGCGTAALTHAILQTAAPQTVLGIDAAEGFIAHARANTDDGRAAFKVGDAQGLPVESASFDAVVSGLMLNFVPQPAQAVGEMVRAARPHGLVAAYVWDYAGKMQFMRHFWNAAVALDPAAADLDEGKRFPLCRPEPLADLFRGAGLTGVEVWPIDIWTTFTDFDDYWNPFLGGQGPAPGYAMALSEERRALLSRRIRLALPYALDGSIPLVARAWSVSGVRRNS